MTLRLWKIVVYGHRGQARIVKFNPHGLSIITGASKTGKSSLIDIVDYCTGRDTCNVADGVIRRAVSWYGVLFDRGDTRIFVARRNPPPGETRNPEAYLEVGADVDVPDHATLTKNITVEALEAYLTSTAGISENVHQPPEGQTRAPLTANFRHALLFSFQDQDEIDSRKVLFHRQGEPFIPQTIKDVLPYFLGAVDEEHLRKQAELDQARKELRKLERLAAEKEEVETLVSSRTADIYREAQVAGFLPEGDVPPPSEAIARLRSIGAAEAAEREPDLDGVQAELQTERARLRSQLSAVREELRQVRQVEELAGGYLDEVLEQRSRLAPLGLLPKGAQDVNACALCGTSLDAPIPTVAELTASLKDLDGQLRTVKREMPRLQALQADLFQRRGGIEAALSENQRLINEHVAKAEQARAERDSRLHRARTSGRITYFLETVRSGNGPSDLETRLVAARERTNALLSLLDPDEVRERLTSFVNIVGEYMTVYSARLDLEHSGSRLRLDLRNLAVVADTPDGPVPLQRMGSGENWVGYHVLAHLALHKWFRQKERPVPAFLIFDQPSQAHYPPERDVEGNVNILGDADREAVYRLFRLMADVAKELTPGFQIIVIDHADLKDDWFADAVVERWRGGQALVPTEWLDQ